MPAATQTGVPTWTEVFGGSCKRHLETQLPHDAKAAPQTKQQLERRGLRASGGPGSRPVEKEPSVEVMGVKEMKAWLDRCGVGHKDCLEKAELRMRVQETQEKETQSASNSSNSSSPSSISGGPSATGSSHSSETITSSAAPAAGGAGPGGASTQAPRRS